MAWIRGLSPCWSDLGGLRVLEGFCNNKSPAHCSWKSPNGFLSIPLCERPRMVLFWGLPMASRTSIRVRFKGLKLQGNMAAKRVLVSLVVAGLAAVALAQSPAASQTAGPASKDARGQIAAGGTIVAELAKSIDAKKAKANDRIEVRMTMDVLAHGAILIPRGTRIIGHVTDARARTKQQPESMVEIAFDHIILKNGREIPLRATIQAVGYPMLSSATANSELAAPVVAGPQSSPGENETRSLISSTFPGSVRPINSVGGAAERTDNVGPPRNQAPSLGQGIVVGMKGIALSNTARGSAISSTSKNVHLGDGTQLVLRIN